ncbi:hypothetical protein [Acidaminococcus intestini]|uniref:hypothetical protein n=1 Tax=Acidaminococcus intestini TaxID=187327 RepID=UPI0027B9CEB8|nr:hypothetical protein [Acidaminococcus intestini]
MNRLNSKKVKGPQHPKYRYPDNVLTASRVALFSQMGIDYQTDVGVYTRALDSQRAKHKTIFGGGYIVPQEAARQAQEAHAYKWELSERELKELMGAEAAAK